MKKSTINWIALGTLTTGLLAFSAGMIYAMHKMKQIQTDDEDLETEELPEETTES